MEDFLIAMGIFIGIAAFANAERLRKRLNRTQDILIEKQVAESLDFIYDEKLREQIKKSQAYND